MNGRQVSLAGHRFRAVVNPRIRGMDCGDAAASDERPIRERRSRTCGHGTSATGCDQIESDGQSGAGGKPAHARPLDGRALLYGGVPNGIREKVELRFSGVAA
jgi:hypothetical protein